MKKFFQGIAIASITVFCVATASAQNIHYVETPTSTDNGTTLTTCGKLAGLGNNQGITITATTTATITTQCKNPAGKIAPGQTRTETVTYSQTFYSDKNGNVSFCVTSPLLAPGTCPNGQWTGTVLDASFTPVQVSWTTN
jgi:hypothetical protein